MGNFTKINSNEDLSIILNDFKTIMNTFYMMKKLKRLKQEKQGAFRLKHQIHRTLKIY